MLRKWVPQLVVGSGKMFDFPGRNSARAVRAGIRATRKVKEDALDGPSKLREGVKLCCGAPVGMRGNMWSQGSTYIQALYQWQATLPSNRKWR